MRPPGQKVYSMLLGKSIGQLLIVPERRKRLGQSRKNVSCGCENDGGEIQSNAVKTILHRNLEH